MEKKKKKSWFRRFKRRFFDALFRLFGPPALGFLFWIYSRTLKMEFDGYELYQQALHAGRPLILAFLHEDLLAIFAYQIRFRPCLVSVMLSQSRDGEKLAPIISRFDLAPIRSSAARGAVRGFMETYRWLKTPREGPTVTAIALDGPLGPRRQVKIGTCMLARKAEALVLPMAFSHSRQVVFRSWDRMLLPKPFARCTCWVHPALDAAQWPEDDAENARRLGELLTEMKEKAGVP